MSGEVLPLPRDGYLLGDHLCQAPGPENHLLCFHPRGHAGPHGWGDWRGCRIRVRVHGKEISLPFGGFAY